jgi:2-phosphosulfolactate phosphatase
VISLLAAGVVVAACIRNAGAVARWIVEEGYGTRAHPVLVLAAGERWADESLRPAVEDAIGAGAVLEYLRQADLPLSAEASVIANLYRSIVDLDEAVRACASARELQAIGYGRDVDDAVALDVDGHVPVLRDGAFTIA